MNAALAWRQRMSETRGEYHTGAAESESETAPTPDEWYTQVANRFMEVAYSEFGLGATRCFLYLIRLTKGFHQECVTLTVDEFCNGKRTNAGRLDSGTKLTRVTVLAGLAELREKHVIEVAQEGRGRGIVSAYRINPSHLWQLCDESIGKETIPIRNGIDALPIEALIGKETIPITGNIGKETIPIQVPSAQAGSGATGTGKKYLLNKLSKEKLLCPTPDGADGGSLAAPSSSELSKPTQKRASTVLPEDGDAVRLAAYLRDAILAHSPNARDAKAALQPDKLQNWARPIDLMLRRDERTPDGIHAVIDFATHDAFWQSNILSPGKLREQYDRLAGRMRQKHTTAPPARAAPPREPPPMRLDRDRPINAKPARIE